MGYSGLHLLAQPLSFVRNTSGMRCGGVLSMLLVIGNLFVAHSRARMKKATTRLPINGDCPAVFSGLSYH
jgi:hypothetical protein